jgi:hypothetical protein
MQLVSSFSVESLDGTKASSLKDSSHAYSPASPNVTATSLERNPYGIAFRPKPGFEPCPPAPRNSVDLHHCCHGSCQRDDKLRMVDDSFETPPNNHMPPPPPVYNGSTSGWLTPGARAKLKKSARTSPSPSFQVSHLLICSFSTNDERSVRPLYLR